MNQDWYQDVVMFHYDLGDRFSTKPHIPGIRHRVLRMDLVDEETKELLAAIDTGDVVGVADGIVDSIVVLLGTAVTYGIDIRPIWDEVHKTNMAKVEGPVRADGKFLKPEGWVPPKVKELLLEQGMEP